MTVSSILTKVNYAGNGSTTVFAVSFKYLLKADIVVTLVNDTTLVETLQVLVTNYTLTIPGATGTVTMLTAPPTGNTLVIEREVITTQLTNYVENDAFPAESHEEALDRVTMIVQELKTIINRIPQLKITTLLSNLPIEEPVGDKLLLYNAAGTEIINGPEADDIAAAEANATAAAASAASIVVGKGADVASAAALPLIADGDYFEVTGTTTVTSFNTVVVGKTIKLRFIGILVLTHHATNLVLPGGANITTAAGDEAVFVEYASGDYRCINYQRAADAP